MSQAVEKIALQRQKTLATQASSVKSTSDFNLIKAESSNYSDVSWRDFVTYFK